MHGSSRPWEPAPQKKHPCPGAAPKTKKRCDVSNANVLFRFGSESKCGKEGSDPTVAGQKLRFLSYGGRSSGSYPMVAEAPVPILWWKKLRFLSYGGRSSVSYPMVEEAPFPILWWKKLRFLSYGRRSSGSYPMVASPPKPSVPYPMATNDNDNDHHHHHHHHHDQH